MGAKIALPFISFMSFVGGSLGSAFKFDEVVEVTCVGVIHAVDMITGDEDLFSFDSFLQCEGLKIVRHDMQPPYLTHCSLWSRSSVRSTEAEYLQSTTQLRGDSTAWSDKTKAPRALLSSARPSFGCRFRCWSTSRFLKVFWWGWWTLLRQYLQASMSAKGGPSVRRC